MYEIFYPKLEAWIKAVKHHALHVDVEYFQVMEVLMKFHNSRALEIIIMVSIDL